MFLTMCRSGGERKRTDLVTLFAMFDLVRQHSRYQAEYLILDEVFDALDKEGLRSVQNIISNLATRVKKLLVISHSDIIKGKLQVFRQFLNFIELPSTGIIRFTMKRSETGKPLGSTFTIIQ